MQAKAIPLLVKYFEMLEINKYTNKTRNAHPLTLLLNVFLNSGSILSVIKAQMNFPTLPILHGLQAAAISTSKHSEVIALIVFGFSK